MKDGEESKKDKKKKKSDKNKSKKSGIDIANWVNSQNEEPLHIQRYFLFRK